ncbi:MAG: nicotinate (nicotinamide) nucleotide adenylyltransferase [Ruminococcus sp.]|nr:nicotinate (nicotinamide) nucleotide adenylyltransferase [Ruminococcus sp.]
MSIAIFGGTFNPPHLGHRRLLEVVTEAVKPDRVFIIPDKIPPHKEASGLVSGEDRLALCRLAFGDIANVEISSYELDREGKSYSYYTVSHFKELYPDDDIYFIMGSDMLLTFDKWYRAEELMKMCIPLCISRCADDIERCRSKAKQFRKAVFVEAAPFEVSSTDIRNIIKNKQDYKLSELLDEKVISYIKTHKLYD